MHSERAIPIVPFLGGNETVAKILQTTGIDALIPAFADAAQAEKSALNSYAVDRARR